MRDFEYANKAAAFIEMTQDFNQYKHCGRGMVVGIDATQEEVEGITGDDNDIDAVFIMFDSGELMNVGRGKIECEVKPPVEGNPMAKHYSLVREPVLKFGGRTFPIRWLDIPRGVEESVFEAILVGQRVGLLDNEWKSLLRGSSPAAPITDDVKQSLHFHNASVIQWLARRQHARDEAKIQGRDVTRVPLQMMQNTGIIARTPKQRMKQARTLTVRRPSGLDGRNRTKCTVELVAGLSGAAKMQAVLFATKGDLKDLDTFMLDAIVARIEGNAIRRYDGVISTFSHYKGGIRIDDDCRWLELEVRRRLGIKQASKNQAKDVRKTIQDLFEVQFEVEVERNVRRKDKTYYKVKERIALFIPTMRTEDGTVTELALHPRIVEGMEKGYGWWISNSILHIDERDGGFTYNLIRALANRWQMKGRTIWQGLDKTLEACGLLWTFKEREKKDKKVAHAYIDAMLAKYPREIGIVEMDWDKRRFIFKSEPLYLRRGMIDYTQQAAPRALPPAAKESPIRSLESNPTYV